MPFIKKTDTKGAQHLIDARKIFIGRSMELQFFKEYILKPEDPTYNIVYIDGQGGVGKSRLLLQFIEDARATEFKDYCLTALVNEREATPARFMEKFADQLHMEEDFEKALKQYKSVLHKLQNQREAAREALVQKSTTDLIGSAVKGIPFAGEFLKEGAGIATSFLIEEFRYRELLKDAERMEDPIGDLTKAFVRDLNRLTETYVTMSSNRLKQRYRVILFFDTFEQLAAECAPWLLDYFLEAEVSNNVVLVIAGRDPLEHSTPADPKRWLPYRDNNTICSISLDSFTEEETRSYLSERGIIDNERIDMIWQLSRGLPLYLSFLTADPQGKVDPTANVVDNFLRWIPEQEQIKRRLALDAALFSRPFNQDELEAFPYVSEQERPTLYNWLKAQPFVQSNSQDGRYNYHQLAQELFSRHLFQQSPKEYRASRRALAEYYRRLLKDIASAGGKDVYGSARWLELTLALIKQLFLLPDETNYFEAIEQTINAIDHTDQTGEIGRLLRELSQEQPEGQVSTEVRQTAEHLLQCAEGDPGDSGSLLAVNYLLRKVLRKPSFSVDTLALIYSSRVDVYYALKRYEEALADTNRAIELSPETARFYDDRGDVYYSLEKYEEALTDYSRAIELSPETAVFYDDRGNAYYSLEKYEEALAAFNRAIELSPETAAYYNRRGNAYYSLEKYEEALAAFNRAIELSPETPVYYNNRGYVYYALKKYEEALAAFNRAIELSPETPVCYNNRGYVYYALKKYEEALTDYSRAIELSPETARFYDDRGDVYYSLEKYEEALTDYSRAIELSPETAIYYYDKGNAYYSLEKYEEALAAFNRAIELSPETPAYYNNRGDVYYALKKYEEALADYSRAIELSPETPAYYNNRGDVYYALKRYEEALADTNRAIELSPETARFYDDRGDVYYSLEKYEEALTDYSRAIELSPETAVFYDDRGNAYRRLKKYEEALADYDRAIELDPKKEWAYVGRGLTYLWLKNVRQAITDYTSSWELNKTDVYGGWMAEWSRMCQERTENEIIQRLEAMIGVDPHCYAAQVSRGAILWLQERFEQARIELEQAIPLEQEPWEAYFWLGMVEVSLRRDDIAIDIVENALKIGLPPVLLTPLRWLEQERSDFYEKYIVPMFSRYKLTM